MIILLMQEILMLIYI